MDESKAKFLSGKTVNTVEATVLLVTVVFSCLGFLRLGQAWAQFRHWEDELHAKSRLNQCFAQTYLSHRIQRINICENQDGGEDCDEERIGELKMMENRALDICMFDYLEREEG